MCVKICGHIIVWQKPIKFYTLIKSMVIVSMLVMVMPFEQAFSGNKPQKSELSPAIILAMALGVRDVSGPMLHSPKNIPQEQSFTSQTPNRRTPLVPQDQGYSPVLSMNTRLPRPSMER